MAFIIDKEALKAGLIIFRRGDVMHRNFYYRIKLPKEDSDKTIVLGTSDRESARDKAFDLDVNIRFRIKHDVPVFDRPFRQVAGEYIALLERRLRIGEVTGWELIRQPGDDGEAGAKAAKAAASRDRVGRSYVPRSARR